MAQRNLAFALAAWCAGCAPSTVVPPVEPGEVLILAVTDSSGHPTQVTRWSGPVERIQIKKDALLLGFAFPESALIGETGAALDLSQLILRPDDQPSPNAEACNHCFSRAAVAPQVLRSGESCPPPLFARELVLLGRAAPESIAAARLAVRIEAPGSCPCTAPGSAPAAEARDFDVRPVAPEGGFWPVERVAQTSSGTLGIFGEHLAVVTGPDGVERARLQSPNVFPGSVLAVAPTAEGGFMVFAHDPSEPLNDERTFVFDADLHALPPIGVPIRVDVAALVPGIGRLFAGASINSSGEHQLLLCPSSGPTDSGCFDLFAPAELAHVGPITDLWATPEGGLAVEEFYRDVVIFERLFPPSQIAQVTASSTLAGQLLATDGRTARWRRVTYPSSIYAQGAIQGVAGQTVFLCSQHAGPPASGAYWLTADDRFFRGVDPDPWGQAAPPGSPCIGLLTGAQSTTISFADGSAVSCSSSTPIACARDPSAVPDDEWLGVRENKVPAFDLAWSGNRVRLRRQGETEWRHAYGRTGPPIPIAALSSRPDQLLAFGTRGQVLTATLGPESSIALALSGLDLGGRPLAAVYDPLDDSFLVSVACAHPTDAELRRVRLEDHRVEPIDLFPARPGCLEVPLLATLRPGRVLAADASGGLYLLGPSRQAEPITIQWDDPETPAAEGSEQVSWQVLSGSAGIGFAVGAQSILRIDSYRSPPVAERIFLGRTTQTYWEAAGFNQAPMLRTIKAQCPDIASLGMRGVENSNIEIGVFWRLDPAPAPRDPPAGLSPVLLTDEARNESAHLSALTLGAGDPRWIIGGGHDWSVAIFDRSLHRLGASWRTRLYGVNFKDALELGPGRFVIASDHGDLFLGTRH